MRRWWKSDELSAGSGGHATPSLLGPRSAPWRREGLALEDANSRIAVKT